MTETPKTCVTCAHRSGSSTFARCQLSGYYIEVERKFPVQCDKDFSGWVKRLPLLTRIKKWLYQE